MKTNQDGLQVLPWHREAARECFHRTSTPMFQDVLEAIARHDPNAAKAAVANIGVHTSGEWDMAETISRMQEQHAETLRLLERALVRRRRHLPYVNESGCAYNLTNEIRTHLAAMKGGQS